MAGERGPAVFVTTSIGVMVASALFATYAFVPSGVIAIATGSFPTGIAVPAVFVAVLIGVTLPFTSELLPSFTTYAVAPSGVMAIAAGASPTGIGVPAVLVAVLIGVTVSLSRFATYAVHAGAGAAPATAPPNPATGSPAIARTTMHNSSSFRFMTCLP